MGQLYRDCQVLRGTILKGQDFTLGDRGSAQLIYGEVEIIVRMDRSSALGVKE